MPPRENVLLDKVAAFAIARKQGVGNDDSLDAGASARFQVAREALKVAGPELFTDGFEHFNRGDAVELLMNVAIVGQLQCGVGGQAGACPAFLGKLQLF